MTVASFSLCIRSKSGLKGVIKIEGGIILGGCSEAL